MRAVRVAYPFSTRSAFRSHSADVAANLKNKVPKAAAQKIMLALAGELADSCPVDIADSTEQGTLTKKDYGKQTIFVYNQVSFVPLAKLTLGSNSLFQPYAQRPLHHLLHPL